MGEGQTKITALLREEMRKLDLNQTELATRIGVGSTVMTRWMQGRVPTAKNLERIAKALSVDLDLLLDWGGYRVRAADGLSDEQARLLGKFRRVELTADRVWLFDLLLDGMLRADRAAKAPPGADTDLKA